MNRYVRQEILGEIGVSGQEKIRKAKVAVVGVGGLGSVCAELLVRAGVGSLLLIDKDVVSLVNLHRQFSFKEGDVGKSKVFVLKDYLSKVNSGVSISVVEDFLHEKNTGVLDGFDLVLDCSDNMLARRVINSYCSSSGKPWIHAAASGVVGNVLFVSDSSVFDKFFRSGESFGDCSEVGVLNSLPVLIASVQVSQAIRFIVDGSFCEGLIRINPWLSSFDVFDVKN